MLLGALSLGKKWRLQVINTIRANVCLNEIFSLLYPRQRGKVCRLQVMNINRATAPRAMPLTKWCLTSLVSMHCNVWTFLRSPLTKYCSTLLASTYLLILRFKTKFVIPVDHVFYPHWQMKLFPSKDGAVGIYFINLSSQYFLCFYTSAQKVCSRLQIVTFLLSPVYTGLCLFMCLLKELGSDQAKSHWLHLFHFSPLCIFKWIFKCNACDDVKSNWLHLFDFSSLWVFKWIIKWPAWEDA